MSHESTLDWPTLPSDGLDAYCRKASVSDTLWEIDGAIVDIFVSLGRLRAQHSAGPTDHCEISGD